MSNNKPAATGGDKAANAAVKDGKPSEKTMPVGTTVVVEMKRACRCGDKSLDVGDPIAEIKLQPGVALNYLSRALEDGIAGAK